VVWRRDEEDLGHEPFPLRAPAPDATSRNDCFQLRETIGESVAFLPGPSVFVRPPADPDLRRGLRQAALKHTFRSMWRRETPLNRTQRQFFSRVGSGSLPLPTESFGERV